MTKNNETQERTNSIDDQKYKHNTTQERTNSTHGKNKKQEERINPTDLELARYEKEMIQMILKKMVRY